MSNMKDFEIQDGVLVKYNGKGGDVVIPEGVTSIKGSLLGGAFSGCTSLTNVTIPSSVTSIGDMAFHGCKSLTSVTIPEGVTSIGRGAFGNCTSLTSVTVPKNVEIADDAFPKSTEVIRK